jgi:HAD superfamily hydrolase (TIGR01484 family)
VRVLLVTGRRPPAARQVADQIAPDLPMALNNGALFVENGAVIRRRPLPRPVARRALAVGRSCRADAVVHAGSNAEGHLMVQRGEAGETLSAYHVDRANPAVSEWERLEEALVEDPIQVMFGGALAAMDALFKRLSSELGAAASLERTVYPATGLGLIDVVGAGVAKAEAVSFFEARWGLSSASTLAIGDNWNDRGMLEAAGRGFVMRNADPAMHRLGLPLLPSNLEDGVAVAIEEHVLKQMRG